MPGVIVRLWPLSWLRGLQGQVNPLASSENHCSKDLFRARRRRLPFEPFLFLVQLRVPVQHNGRRPDVHVLDLRVDQKSLPILAEGGLQQAGSGAFPAQTHQGSGERLQTVAQFGLQLHADKARIVNFGRQLATQRSAPILPRTFEGSLHGAHAQRANGNRDLQAILGVAGRLMCGSDAIPLERHTWRRPMQCPFSIFHFPGDFSRSSIATEILPECVLTARFDGILENNGKWEAA